MQEGFPVSPDALLHFFLRWVRTDRAGGPGAIEARSFVAKALLWMTAKCEGRHDAVVMVSAE